MSTFLSRDVNVKMWTSNSTSARIRHVDSKLNFDLQGNSFRFTSCSTYLDRFKEQRAAGDMCARWLGFDGSQDEHESKQR